MILTEQFFIFHLVYCWAMFILCKDNWMPRILEEKGNKIGHEKVLGRFILGISECSFCRNNWFALPVIIPLAIYFNDYNILIWGVLSSSISAQLSR